MECKGRAVDGAPLGACWETPEIAGFFPSAVVRPGSCSQTRGGDDVPRLNTVNQGR